METALTKLGYRIPLTEENEERCKKELIHKPKVNPYLDYGKKEPSIWNYKKSKRFLYVPQSYGIETYGVPVKDYLDKNAKKINIEFTGTLRPVQEEMVTATEKCFEGSNKGGIWNCSTGIGKTFAALFMIAKMGVKTMVVVNKEVLKRQWQREIAKVLPAARVGILQSDNIDVKDKDIVICMLQSVSKRNYSPDIFDDINFLIIDETHNVASLYFSRLLYKIQTKYKLGLSATPNRKDGLEIVFKQHLGDIIVEINNLTVEPKIQFINVRDLEPDIRVHKTRQGNTNSARLITDISKSKKRNQLIVREVLKLLQQKRNIIVFSDRVEHCKLLNYVTLQTIKKYNLNYSCAIFIGGMKDEEYDFAKTCNVLFATYGLAKEGFDHSILDSCVLGTPKSDIVQVVGRILRKENENFPLVIDLVDRDFSPLNGMYNRRRRYYKSQSWELLPNKELDEEMKENAEPFPLVDCVIIEEE